MGKKENREFISEQRVVDEIFEKHKNKKDKTSKNRGILLLIILFLVLLIGGLCSYFYYYTLKVPMGNNESLSINNKIKLELELA